MTDSGTRVAVYIDFDNIVISRYDQVHGRNAFSKDRVRTDASDAEVTKKLQRATVDVGAVIDFASSYGTLVLTRAYADWSAPVNAEYRGQLVGRAVDLVQLFPAAAYAKNGADIRLAVDAVEDMFRLPDLTHVIIVAGDSDYIALAQRCRRLGRYVVGVGVAGSTSRSLGAACDEMVTYDALPGIEAEETPAEQAPPPRRRRSRSSSSGPAEPQTTEQQDEEVESEAEAESDDEQDADPRGERSQSRATRLLERALRLGHEKDDADWLHSSTVKTQMKRMDPSFSEKALGYRSFTAFVESRKDVVETDETDSARLVRLRR